jgi:hypothetical protein
MFADQEIAKIAEIAKIGKARPRGENTDSTNLKKASEEIRADQCHQ